MNATDREMLKEFLRVYRAVKMDNEARERARQKMLQAVDAKFGGKDRHNDEEANDENHS